MFYLFFGCCNIGSIVFTSHPPFTNCNPCQSLSFNQLLGCKQKFIRFFQRFLRLLLFVRQTAHSKSPFLEIRVCTQEYGAVHWMNFQKSSVTIMYVSENGYSAVLSAGVIFFWWVQMMYMYIYRSAWSMVWAGQPFCSTFKAQSNSMYTYTRMVRLYTYIFVSSERIYTVMPLVADIAALNAWYHFCWSLIIRDCSKDKGIVSILWNAFLVHSTWGICCYKTTFSWDFARFPGLS